MFKRISASVFGLVAILSAGTGQTQGMPKPKLVDPLPSPGKEIPLNAGDSAPNSERWNLMGDDPVVRNISRPTLSVFQPAPGTANGAAVLVAPGGGFMILSIKNEGWDVAANLAKHGVTAFVLKYRVQPTPPDEAEFDRMGRERMAKAFKPGEAGAPPPAPPVYQPAVDDAVSALKLIRSRASEWKIDPKRLGMIGFSAGAMSTLQTALTPHTDLAFIGLIYGPMAAVSLPADAPPLFAALASDDPLMGRSGMGLLDSYRSVNRPFEFHLYQRGGHGFGMLKNGTTTELWSEEFLAWLHMNKLFDK